MATPDEVNLPQSSATSFQENLDNFRAFYDARIAEWSTILNPLSNFSENISASLFPIKQFSDSTRKALLPLNPISESIERSNSQLAKFLETITANTSPIQQISANLNNIVASLYPGVLMESLKGIAEYFDKYNPFIAKASQILSKHGWWIMNDIPISFYVEVAQKGDKVTAEEITIALTKYFNTKKYERLTHLVNRWGLDQFATRTNIFQDSLWAHKRKRYTLSVPALIVQVEAIIREYIKDNIDPKFTARKPKDLRVEFNNQFQKL